MTERIEAMVDIETLDSGPRSVVLSVGAVKFTQEAGIVGGEFYDVLEIAEQLIYERTISESTLLWWAGQNSEAREEVFRSKGRRAPWDVIKDLTKFLDGIHAIWANSPSFDCVILDTLADDLSLPSPWHYWDLRDLRTARELVGSAGKTPWLGGDKYPTHHPLGDCTNQVQLLRAARAKLFRK